MKSVVLIYEDAAGLPQPELDGRTPLEVARCPAATRLVSEGRGGVLGKLPGRAVPTAESRLAALCGVAPQMAAVVARGPLEAVSSGVDVTGYSHAYLGELVTLDNGALRDARLARLTLQETEQFAREIQKLFDPARVRLVAGAPGRVVVLARAEGESFFRGQAPWLFEGEYLEGLPSRRGAELIQEMLERSAQALMRHAINDVRVDLGENPANALWLWGGGPLARTHSGFSGRLLMLTQSAMAAGLARAIGADVEVLPDPWSASQATEVVDRETLQAWLQDYDRVVVYVESPPELRDAPAGERVRLLERMDVLLTQPLLEVFKWLKQRRFALVSVDASVPEESAQRAPQLVALWGSHLEPDAVEHWDEPSCRDGGLAGVPVDDLEKMLLGE